MLRIQICVSHNNLFFAKNKFSSPGLGYSRARELCLRLHTSPAHEAVHVLSARVTLRGVEPRLPP